MAMMTDIWNERERPVTFLGSWFSMRPLDDFFTQNRVAKPSSENRSIIPKCDMQETQDYYLLSFDMPGVDKENIQVETHNDRLYVSAERREEQQGDNKAQSRVIERRYGRFERSIALPPAMRSEGIEAQYADGVLRIAIAKSGEKGTRKIPVEFGKGHFFDQSQNGMKQVDQQRSPEPGPVEDEAGLH